MSRIDGFDDAADEFGEFAENLREAAAGVDAAVDGGVKKTSEQVEGTAKEYAAVESGTLRSSISHRRIDVAEYVVGSPVEYAPDVEFGTQPHVITPNDGEFLYFEGEDGHLIRKRSVNHPGTPAQPYLRPALREHQSDLGKNIAEAIDDLLHRTFG